MSLESVLSRFTLQRFGVIVFSLILAGYGIFEAYDLWIGPSITITKPAQGALILESLVTIEGNTRNVSWISMLGRPITVDEQGRFREKLLLPPGYSILTFEAKDRLGRKVHQTLAVVRPDTLDPALPQFHATSTAATSTEASIIEATSTEEILINEP